MKPLRVGVREFDDGSSWVHWLLFPRLTDDELGNVIDENDLNVWYEHPGGMYAHLPSVHHTKHRTLITQRGGWDI